MRKVAAFAKYKQPSTSNGIMQLFSKAQRRFSIIISPQNKRGMLNQMRCPLDSICIPAPNCTYDGPMYGGSSQWLMTCLNPLVVKHPRMSIIDSLHATF